MIKIMTYILTISRHVRQIHHLFAKLTERFDEVSKSGALFNRVQTCSHVNNVHVNRKSFIALTRIHTHGHEQEFKHLGVLLFPEDNIIYMYVCSLLQFQYLRVFKFR